VLISVGFAGLRLSYALESYMLCIGSGILLFGMVIALVVVFLRRWKDRMLVFGLLVCIYMASYFLMSVNGRYEPGVWGLSGPKWYAWAPAGFVQEFRWNDPLILMYYPLYELDRRYWHRDDDSHSGKYPVNDCG